MATVQDHAQTDAPRRMSQAKYSSLPTEVS